MISINSLFNFTKTASPFKSILWSGLVAGILDSIAGIIVYYLYFGLDPLQVLQFIASGIYGPTAINGGFYMIIIGIFFHFLIAYTCAIIYFLLYPKIDFLIRYKVISGLLFGLGIWLVMNLLILPYSNIPKSSFDFSLALVGIIWHMILVGLPIAMVTALHFNARRKPRLNQPTDQLKTFN